MKSLTAAIKRRLSIAATTYYNSDQYSDSFPKKMFFYYTEVKAFNIVHQINMASSKWSTCARKSMIMI